GVLPEILPLAIPMPHVTVNHKVRNEADVVLILGSRVGETDWWGKPPYWRNPAEQQTIQADIDANILGVNKPVNIAVQADIARFLSALADELETRQQSNLSQRQQRLTKYGQLMAKERANWDKALTNLCE